MAEGGSSVDFIHFENIRKNRVPRKPQKKETENVFSKIITKRPPRRPKLKDENGIVNVPISQVVEKSEIIVQETEDGTKQSTKWISQIVQNKKIIEEVEEEISSLRLDEDSQNSVLDTTKSSLLALENLITKTTKKKAKKLQKRIKKIQVDEDIDSDKIKKDEASSSTNVSKKQRKSAKVAKADLQTKQFSQLLSIDVVKRILAIQDPEDPNVIEGNIRINPNCPRHAYVSSTTSDSDILIVGLRDRNSALEGDLVAIVVNTRDKWVKLQESVLQRTGKVVSIIENVHSRKAVGFLKKQNKHVYLQPRDSRLPLIKIDDKTTPLDFHKNPDLYKDTIFLCQITDWKNMLYAEGRIEQLIGLRGELSSESNAILLQNNLILTPYEDELLSDLPPANYIPTESDIIDREDLRKTCIFTIDPATAVDLDDAVSCKRLENGNFEIGVHISDVTHFLEAFSPLDRKVAERATTVYMVDTAYHMLPKQLCLACSLLPGQDKLAFSVILEMNSEAEVVNYRFSKTVINSCCQMAYEQAQIMIDDDTYDWTKDNSLKIFGNYKPENLIEVVRNLFQLSTRLKNKRFENGALKIDQPKLCISLDKDTKLPISYKLEDRKESNSLIEEFMLLANMTVAKYLYEKLPEVALLRSHPEPSSRVLTKIRDLLTKFGVLLDVESAKTLQNSLLMYQPNFIEDSTGGSDIITSVAQYRMMVINSLCAKSMMRAVYKCSASANSKEALRHYSLNVEYYTHFTSPIRRYPDCVVHRLLYATIQNKPPPPNWSSFLCSKVADKCNTKKYSARLAQEQSTALYFTYLLDLKGSMDVLAIVTDVTEHSVEVMLCDTGLKLRLRFSQAIEETTVSFTLNDGVPTVQLTWTERQIVEVINIFSILHVRIMKHPESYKLKGILLPPIKLSNE